MFDPAHGPTLSEVWDARMQKVVDRKNRMADVFGEPESEGARGLSAEPVGYDRGDLRRV